MTIFNNIARGLLGVSRDSAGKREGVAPVDPVPAPAEKSIAIRSDK